MSFIIFSVCKTCNKHFSGTSAEKCGACLDEELAALRQENQETREFIGSIAKGLVPKKLCDGCGHYHILDSDYALMVQYAKSFLPKSEGKGGGGEIG